MWRLTLARGVLFLMFAKYSIVMCGAWPGTYSDLTVASFQYDILLCSETLVSDMHHVFVMMVPGFGRAVLSCRGEMPRAGGMAAYVRDGYGVFRQPKFECGCCEMLVFRVCGVRQNLLCSVFTATLSLMA